MPEPPHNAPTQPTTLAAALLAGDRGARDAVATAPIAVRPDNFVERPWGGRRLAGWKGVPGDDARIGECFEIAADSNDAEAAAHPSIVTLADGSSLPLPTLLAAAGDRVLGAAHLARHGARLPVLPKTLDVAELLSVQAHPPGHPEVYVVIEADPGATLHVGLRRDMALGPLRRMLSDARAAQAAIVARLREPQEQVALHAALAPLLLDASAARDALEATLTPFVAANDRAAMREPLARLHAACIEMLDALNPIAVAAGNVVFNADPASRTRGRPDAAIHALGNPAGRELLLLEIRKPGATLRAWDHGRFPPRTLRIDDALAACALTRTRPRDYLAAPRPVAGQPGVTRSVACPDFVVEHLSPTADAPVERHGQGRVRTVHAIRGQLRLRWAHAHSLELPVGRSALLPADLPPYRVEGEAGSELVEVTLP